MTAARYTDLMKLQRLSQGQYPYLYPNSELRWNETFRDNASSQIN